jgi:hypothetical protein
MMRKCGALHLYKYSSAGLMWHLLLLVSGTMHPPADLIYGNLQLEETLEEIG